MRIIKNWVQLFLMFYITWSLPVYGQNLNFEWVRFGKGISYSNGIKTALDNNNNINLTGFYSGSLNLENNILISNGSYDIYMVKYDTIGNLLLNKQIGGILNDNIRDLIFLNNGYYLSGHTTNSVEFDSINVFSINNNSFIARYSKNYSLQFLTFPYSDTINAPNDIQINENNIYVVGRYNKYMLWGTNSLSSHGLSSEAYFAKIDTFGNVAWLKSFGGFGYDVGSSVCTDNLNNVYITGYFQGTAYFGSDSLVAKGASDIFLIKLSANGNLIWMKSLGGKFDDNPSKMLLDQYNNIILTGFYQDTLFFNNLNLISKGSRDMFIVKMDPLGNVIWIKSYGGIGLDSPSAMEINNTGDIYLTGQYSTVADFNGFTLNSLDQDFFLLKINEFGNGIWIENFHGAGLNSCSSITLSDNCIYLSGYYNNSQFFDGVEYFTTGNYDSFLVKYREVKTNPLPVELISYKVVCTQTGALITWTTSSETNNDFFAVEKTTDMKDWKIISTIQTYFNTNEPKEYQIIDTLLLLDQLTYYRLKQTDINGNYKYFDALSVLCGLKNDNLDIIGINISDTHFNVMVKTNGFDLLHLELYDNMGRLISQKETYPVKGVNTISIEVNNVIPGIYVIALHQKNELKIKKILLE